MNMIKTALAATALAFALATSAVAADSTTTATTKTTTAPAKTPKVKAAAKPRSAESIKCSQDADAKGLHGAARKTFRKSCMKGKPN